MTSDINWNEVPNLLNLLHKYAWDLDNDTLDGLREIFHQNGETGGTVNGEPSWGPWKGVDDIICYLSKIRQSLPEVRRHQVTTPIFSKLTDSTADFCAYLSVLGVQDVEKPRVITTGEYHVTASRDIDGYWKINTLFAKLDHQF